MANDMEAQIERERQEIENAPVITSSAIVGRCSFCGQPASDLTLVEAVAHGNTTVQRFKCERCARR